MKRKEYIVQILSIKGTIGTNQVFYVKRQKNLHICKKCSIFAAETVL